MSEWAFLEWLARTDRSGAAIPIGDDAAGLDLPERGPLLFAIDTLSEGSHFEAGTDPARIGAKALAVNLSDLAAMGGRPLGAVASLALPRDFASDDAQALTRGLREMGSRWGCPLVGGDTVTHDQGLVVTVAVIGVPAGARAITRQGASAEQAIVVTGAIGGSIGGRHLDFEPRLDAGARLAKLGCVSAMLDLSDGLLIDLHRLADQSGVGFEVDEQCVPLHPDARNRTPFEAMGDGEDFELLFTMDPARLDELRGAWDSSLPALTVIGRTLCLDEGRWLLRDGGRAPAPRRGFEHR